MNVGQENDPVSFDRGLVTILIPARNEEQHVVACLEDVTRACAELELRYELLVVESGSSDRTAELVQHFAADEPRVRLISVAEPGYGIAMIRGIERSRGEFVVFFNVDFWDLRFLQLTKVDNLGYDVTSGSKLLPGSHDARNLFRRVVSRSFNRLFIRTLLGFRGTDTHGVKVLRHAAVRPIMLRCVTSSDIFDTELMVRCQRAGLRMLELPVNVVEIRPTRFTGRRILRIPADIIRLYGVLSRRTGPAPRRRS